MSVQDDVILLAYSTSPDPNNLSTEPISRLTAETDADFTSRIIARSKALSALINGGDVWVYTAEGRGNVTISDVALTDVPDSFISGVFSDA